MEALTVDLDMYVEEEKTINTFKVEVLDSINKCLTFTSRLKIIQHRKYEAVEAIEIINNDANIIYQ